MVYQVSFNGILGLCYISLHLCMHGSRDIRYSRSLLLVYEVSFIGIRGLF
jgi:hypothetical protein